MAERAGFEPAVRYLRTHAFQACSLNHSDTSPQAKGIIFRGVQKSQLGAITFTFARGVKLRYNPHSTMQQNFFEEIRL